MIQHSQAVHTHTGHTHAHRQYLNTHSHPPERGEQVGEHNVLTAVMPRAQLEPNAAVNYKHLSSHCIADTEVGGGQSLGNNILLPLSYYLILPLPYTCAGALWNHIVTEDKWTPKKTHQFQECCHKERPYLPPSGFLVTHWQIHHARLTKTSEKSCPLLHLFF